MARKKKKPYTLTLAERYKLYKQRDYWRPDTEEPDQEAVKQAQEAIARVRALFDE